MPKFKKSKKAKSELAGERTIKRFRVAREGKTIDGRSLARQSIIDMVDSYDPVDYTARINCEHISGWFDGLDGRFSALGDVIAIDCQLETFNIGGEDVELMCLYATLSALPRLVEANKEGKKLFTSIEVTPNFAETGRPYLSGLAVTDSPAIRGTEPLKFSKQKNTYSTEPQELLLMSTNTKHSNTKLDDSTETTTPTADNGNGKKSDDKKGRFSFIEKLKKFTAKKGLDEEEENAIVDGFTSVHENIDELQSDHDELQNNFNALADKFENLEKALASQDFSTQIDPVAGGGMEQTDF